MNPMKSDIDIRYFSDTDTLSLWNGVPASEAGDIIAVGELIYDANARGDAPADIIADYDADGKVVGFTIEHAAELLLRPLAKHGGASDAFVVNGMFAGYGYTLSLAGGALTLRNHSADIARSDEVGVYDGGRFTARLTAHYDAAGDAAGFTLTHAADALLPLLIPNALHTVAAPEPRGV